MSDLSLNLVDRLIAADLLFDASNSVLKHGENRDIRLFSATVSVYDQKTDGDHTPDLVQGSGTSFNKADADNAACGEALESISANSLYHKKPVVAKKSNLKKRVIDPIDIGLCGSAIRKDENYDYYRNDSRIGWVEGFSITHKEDVLIPALSVYLNYQAQEDESIIFSPGSNGLGAGQTLDHALLSGLYEVIERDALLRVWLNRISCKRLTPDTLSPTSQMAIQMKKNNINTRFYLLPNDFGVSVVLCVLIREVNGSKSAFVGCASSLSRYAATEKSYVEAVSSLILYRYESRDPQVIKRIRDLQSGRTAVKSMEDHGYYYREVNQLTAFDFLESSDTAQMVQYESKDNQTSADKIMQALVKNLSKNSLEVIGVDLTIVPVFDIGMFVARVVVPGLIPMFHGPVENRLDASNFFNSGNELLSGYPPLTTDNLNHHPHPLG